jgi:hypothetical protein
MTTVKTIPALILMLMTIVMLSTSAYADFCVSNKGTKSRYIDISCGIDAARLFKNEYRLVKPGGKLCKKNKVLFIPVPCIARITDKKHLAESGSALKAPLSAASITMGGSSLNNVDPTKPFEIILPGVGQFDKFCKIGPVYNSKVIRDNVLDKLDAKRNVFALCHYR